MALSSIESNAPATLLIVDDDSSAREGLRSIFETAGHKTITVSDAPAALRLLHEQSCDLVMLDGELPEVDGLSFCRLVRAQPSLKQMPLVVFSANDSEGRKVAAFTAGADDYIVKPCSPGELVSRVNSHLGIAQRESELRGNNRELSFLADLSRGLLRTLEPEQLARRLAGAMFEGTNAAMTATAIRDNAKGLAVCVFDREGSAGSSALIHQKRLDKWLSSARSNSALRITNR
jgi:CheY-like chemotaxis protein